MTSNYLRYPDVRGDEIVFVADDDIWAAPLTGGRAWRLTSDHAPVTRPKLSPDASRLAWSSAVDGLGDAYVLERASGRVQRLTHWNAGLVFTRVLGWTDDEHLIVVCPTMGAYRGETYLYLIGLDGTSQRLPYGLAMGLATHPSGVVVTNTPNGRDSAMWKRYRGGTASRLWLRPSEGEGWRRLLPEVAAGCYAPSFFGDRLIFSSDLGGDLPQLEQAQLWSLDLNGDDLRQHTNHDVDAGYVRDPATDGSTIVYHARGRLYSMAGLDAKPQPIEIDLAVQRRSRPADVSQIGALQPDRGADGSAFEWRGAAYYLTHRAGPARALCAVPGVRVREVMLLGDTGQVVYVRDDDDIDRLEIARIDGTGEPRQLAVDQLGYILHLAATRTGDRIAAVSHDGRVSLVDVESSTVTTVQQQSNGEPTGLAFSPDGRYLAWRDPRLGEGEHGAIRVCDTSDEQHRVFDVTSGLFNDGSPVFTPDGKYLAFLSDRVFDPVYNSHDFDLSFGDSTRPYLLPLRADEPVPFGPSVDGWPIGEVIKASAEQGSDQPPAGEAPEPAEAKVTCQIDEQGIWARAVALPVPVGRHSRLRAAADGLLWLDEPPTAGELGQARSGVEGDAPKPRLERFSLTARKAETIVEALDDYEVSGDGARIVYRHDENLFVAPADRKVEEKDPMLVAIDSSRLRRQIDPAAEWDQMVRETHLLMRDNYWRADLDGIDWPGTRERYREVARRAASKDDVVDVLWEMIGELNTGHCYVTVQPPHDLPRAAGLLGADLQRQPDGSQRIERILPAETSDPRAASPLLAPGVAAQAGDLIVAVNGQRLTPDLGLGELLAGSPGKVTELVLARDGDERRVAVVPLASEAKLRYHDWVASRRAYVDEHSGGRLGYVHIPDMMAEGWAQFYRDIHEATRREGIVVDVRYNAGGHTSELIVEKLARRVLAWGRARWYTEPYTYPSDAIRGSMVVVTNQFAGSDGDIVNAAVKSLGLAPVIGERTWGGVIGIDGRYGLVDGTSVTQPRYGLIFAGGDWYDIENHGVDPDIEVVRTPADWDSPDVDVQLDAAIAESFRQLEQRPAGIMPEFPPPRIG